MKADLGPRILEVGALHREVPTQEYLQVVLREVRLMPSKPWQAAASPQQTTEPFCFVAAKAHLHPNTARTSSAKSAATSSAHPPAAGSPQTCTRELVVRAAKAASVEEMLHTALIRGGGPPPNSTAPHVTTEPSSWKLLHEIVGVSGLDMSLTGTWLKPTKTLQAHSLHPLASTVPSFTERFRWLSKKWWVFDARISRDETSFSPLLSYLPCPPERPSQ